MPLNTTHLLMIAAVLGAAGFAMFNNNHASAPASTPVATVPAPDHATADFLPQESESLPPNHPPIAQSGAHGGATPAHGSTDDFAPADQAPAVLTWKAPAEWSSMPNPSSMRLATNKVPRVAGDSEDAELSISRAGGETDANIQRWIGQFDGAGKEQRRTKMVQGFNVKFVEVEGTYAGGMGASNATHKNWALLGAIVETPPQSYFFKVTGPAATVHAARKAFGTMIDGIVAR